MSDTENSPAPGPKPGLLDRLRQRLWRRSGSSPSAGLPEIPNQQKLERKLGYRFDGEHHLRQALTHRSHVHVTGMDRLQSNERLEFLGDAVLGLIVNEFLYEEFEGKEEGDLTKIKSLLVCGATLARVGDRLGLGEHLFLSRSEAGTGGRKRESILADATEAVIGAVYMDGGLEKAREFISRVILINVEATLEEGSHRNYKSLLQETLQARYKVPPRYRVTYTTGPDHARRFTVKVTLKGTVLGVGSGTSKKQAEQRAAESALGRLSELENEGTLPAA
jgi:ribonuclease-3